MKVIKLWIVSGSWMLALLMEIVIGVRQVSLYIEPLGLYLPPYLLVLVLMVFEVMWSFVLPFHSDCSNGGWLELLSNIFPIQLILLALFAQYHLITMAVFLLVIVGMQVVFRYSRRSVRNTRREKRLRRRVLVLTASLVLAVPSMLVLCVYGVSEKRYQPRIEHLNALIEQASHEVREGELIPDQELLLCFQEKNWSGYTTEEKLTLVKCLADKETDRLGIPPVPLYAGKEEKYTLGHYNIVREEIMIDSEYLAGSGAKDVIETIFHEVYHAYQDYVVKSVDWRSELSHSAYFSTARAWKENQQSYINSDGTAQGYELYTAQPLESSAQRYAEQRMGEVMELLYPDAYFVR